MSMSDDLKRFSREDLEQEIKHRKKVEDLAAAAGQSKLILEDIARIFGCADPKTHSGSLRYNERLSFWVLTIRIGDHTFDLHIDNSTLKIMGSVAFEPIPLHNPKYLLAAIDIMMKKMVDYSNREVTRLKSLLSKEYEKVGKYSKWQAESSQRAMESLEE